MQKTFRIIEILVGVLVGLPVFVVTAYNLYRQEINPFAPPLINILPDWHWAIWLSILFFICIIMLVLEHFRNKNGEVSSIKSHANNGGQSFVVGRNMNINAPVTSDQSITLNSVSIIQDNRTSVTNIYHLSQGDGVISKRDSEELALNVERVPTNIIRNQGKDVKALALLVTSQERRKIVELKARIDFRHSYNEPGFTVFSRLYNLNSFLFWDDGKNFVKETELRPDIQKILVLCEFLKYKTSDDEIVNMAILTSDPYPESIDFSEESIFQINITFQGRLEGEYEYRSLHYKEFFYTKPKEQRILFLDDAEKTYSDIPQELLKEGKR